MGSGAILEPLAVIVLLFGGTWINRTTIAPPPRSFSRDISPDSIESGLATPSSRDGLLSRRSPSPSDVQLEHRRWRKRQIGFFAWTTKVSTPDTIIFEDRLLSRLLRRFPFLVECCYWALVYWTYQIGRAFTAVTLQEGTIGLARKHALQLIQIEEALGIFCEVPIQRFFVRHERLMSLTNWVYSFIHIPGTIAFLVWLYYYTITRNRSDESPRPGRARGILVSGCPVGPHLYQARRRTLAVCNLLAFVVFTLWPCMPPRLLDEPNGTGELGRRYGFVDTVHGAKGMGSVWTENRFCNQYAAMPSLHFGYSLLIGLTIMTIPLAPHHRRSMHCLPRLGGMRMPSWRRLACLIVGLGYPFIILAAIVATANHFILDAVAGAAVSVLGWWFNRALLNLLVVEDYFLWAVRIHKPESTGLDSGDVDDVPDQSALKW